MMEPTFSLGVSILFLSFIGTTYSFTRYKKLLISTKSKLLLGDKLHDFQRILSRTTTMSELESLIHDDLPQILSTQSVVLEMYTEGEKKLLFRELYEFFHNNTTEKVFINRESYVSRFYSDLRESNELTHLPKCIGLIFPILSISGHLIGILVLSPKMNTSPFSNYEITSLIEFTFFLENHLKYIRTYSLMHEFSMLLDKRVDTKILEYNSLVNRQKEFISLVSHEVRSPLTSAIFQTDTVLDAIESTGIFTQKIYREIQELKSQLVRTGSLMSKLFSVEHYDTQGMHLTKEEIKFGDFLEYEIELFSRIYPDIAFISEVEDDIGSIALDKILFQQVITNLLDNAVKYADKNDGIILISAKKDVRKVILEIEDNGKGFQGISQKNIFDKYFSGNNSDIGLGLGLYLCKKIVTLHSGRIEALHSLKYGGACFRIELPIHENERGYSKIYPSL